MISIIIPAYKATKYIDECISSIKGYVNYEILVGVDHCKETFTHLKNNSNIQLFYFL